MRDLKNIKVRSMTLRLEYAIRAKKDRDKPVFPASEVAVEFPLANERLITVKKAVKPKIIGKPILSWSYKKNHFYQLSRLKDDDKLIFDFDDPAKKLERQQVTIKLIVTFVDESYTHIQNLVYPIRPDDDKPIGKGKFNNLCKQGENFVFFLTREPLSAKSANGKDVRTPIYRLYLTGCNENNPCWQLDCKRRPENWQLCLIYDC